MQTSNEIRRRRKIHSSMISHWNSTEQINDLTDLTLQNVNIFIFVDKYSL